MAGVAAPQAIVDLAAIRNTALVPPLPARRKRHLLMEVAVGAKATPVKARRSAIAVQNMDIGELHDNGEMHIGD
jgi:hypothetical protein